MCVCVCVRECAYTNARKIRDYIKHYIHDAFSMCVVVVVVAVAAAAAAAAHQTATAKCLRVFTNSQCVITDLG